MNDDRIARIDSQVRALHGSDTDLRATPQDFFDSLNMEFMFTLDPCASVENAKCPQFFTKDDDGLSKDWTGRVFCNPPYSDIEPWMKKGHDAVNVGGADVVVFLVPSRTGTKWWHSYAVHHELRWVRGRLKFGGLRGSAPFDVCLVIMRRHKATSA